MLRLPPSPILYPLGPPHRTPQHCAPHPTPTPHPHRGCAPQGRSHVPGHRKVRFVHVKINRAHCRATYEGYPL